MPSFTIHGLIPLLFLLSVRRLDARKVWALWPLTFLPDADYVLEGLHRAVTGNVFVMLPFAAALAWSLWPNQRRPALTEWMTIALVYLASHLVMDVFTGGSVLFWPFTDYNYCYLAYVNVRTATNTLEPHFDVCSASGVPTLAEVYPWLSVWEGAILAFILPAGLVMGGISAWELWREKRAAQEGA